MISDVAQRWCDRRASYRPAGETIRTSSFEVAPIADDNTPRSFVEQHHYSGSYPAARFRFGLYRHGELEGVAVFSHPCNDKVLTSVFHGPALESVELGRFVLLDAVEGNGETWFLARCFESLRAEGLRGVVSFSDPVPRVTSTGAQVFRGHVGTIYQAHNAAFLGRGTARTLRLLADGRNFNARTAQKIRANERGSAAAIAALVDAGAAQLVEGEDAGAWLRRELPRATRTMRHPGNYRYAWGLNRAARRALPRSLPYPKLKVAA